MIKIIVVEDELLIRNELIQLIPWKDEGMCIAGEASNGAIALDMLESVKPDIILLDIKMPVMDGLTFLERMLEKGYKAKIIILSSYGDFSYAQTAIKSGVNDYILKHKLEKHSLLSTIKKAAAELKMERDKEAKLNELQETLSEVLPAGKQAILRDILEYSKDKVSSQSAIKQFKKLGLSLNNESYHLLFFFVDNYYNILADTEAQNLVKLSMIHSIQAVILNYNNGEVFTVNNNTFCLLLNKLDYISESENRAVLYNIVNQIKALYHSHGSLSFSTVIIPRLQDICQLSIYYAKACEFIKIRAFTGRGSTFFLNESNIVVKQCKYDDIKGCFENIKKFIVYLEPDKMEDQLKVLFFGKIKPSCDLNILEYTINELIKIYNSLLEKEKVQAAQQIDTSEIMAINTLECYYDFFCGKLHELIALIKEQTEFKNDIINKAVQYIKKKYYEEISLESVARNVNVNSYYLSWLFKKEAGETFSDYVNHIRIKKAKELLDDEKLKVYEVAIQVGFNDPKYFSMVFKKVTGMSPIDYRKSKTKFL